MKHSLTGDQRPTHRLVPDYLYSEADRAIDLAAIADLHPDPWQRLVLQDAMGVTPEGKWAAPDVGLIVPRQNGKGSVLEIRALAGLFLFKQEKLILWSAHEHKTAREAFLRLKAHVENTPSLNSRVSSIRVGNGEESIETKDGSRIRFLARSSGSGRGFSADLVILDEAFALTDDQLSAILPTILARPNRQVWYTSSAPNLTSSVLRRICKRGRKGDSKSLAYSEWCAKATDEIGARESWAKANPGYGIRLMDDAIQSLYESMDPEDFQREVLGVWLEDVFETVIDIQIWNSLIVTEEEAKSAADGAIAFGIDVTPDRRFSAISAATQQDDGTILIEVIDVLPGTAWVVPRLKKLVEKHEPCVVMIDGNSPATSLISELEEAGLKVTKEPEKGEEEIVVKATLNEFVQACGLFYDAATGIDPGTVVNEDGEEIEILIKGIRHLDDEALNTAIEGAAQRPLSDAWAWSRKSSACNIAPLVAGTLALYGLSVHGHEEEVEPFVFFGSR